MSRPQRKPVKKVVKIKLTQKPKPVRMSGGGLVKPGNLPSKVINGKRVYYG